jgi:hypothetical protein
MKFIKMYGGTINISKVYWYGEALLSVSKQVLDPYDAIVKFLIRFRVLFILCLNFVKYF